MSERVSVLIYWCNFTGAPVVLLETSSTVCRCGAGHTGRERESERARVCVCESVCVCACVFGCMSKTKVEFLSQECLAGQKKEKKKTCLKQQSRFSF